MEFDFLQPINASFEDLIDNSSNGVVGKKIKKHTIEDGLPSFEDVKIAIVGVKEGRGAINNETCSQGVDSIREELYKLYSGNWNLNIIDLGNIEAGYSIRDTYFALSQLTSELIKKNIVLVVIGGGQDLTYANYRGYDSLENTVNLVSIDNRFDLGVDTEGLNSRSYLNAIVVEEPNNLFNYTNIGYQTFFNAQEEIDLIDKLYFDTYRLGQVASKLESIEPVLRDADIVSVDIGVVRQSDAPGNQNASPNGFYSEDLCTISRYAGISDKLSSIGFYEYNPTLDIQGQTAKLVSQAIWYFIEGVSCRVNDYPFGILDDYQKYIVPIDDKTLNFYKSNKSGRWWVDLSLSNNQNKYTLIPCAYEDYLSANKQEIPDRWYKMAKKVI